MNMIALSNAGANICNTWNAGNNFMLDNLKHNPDAIAAAATAITVLTALSAGDGSFGSLHRLVPPALLAFGAMSLPLSIEGHSSFCGADKNNVKNSQNFVGDFVVDIPRGNVRFVANIGFTVVRGASKVCSAFEQGAANTSFNAVRAVSKVCSVFERVVANIGSFLSSEVQYFFVS